MTKVVWSPLALERLVEAAEFISDDDPQAASRWAAGAFDAVARLVQFPRSGVTVAELGRDDVREILYGEYRILYRLEPPHVLILTVRHGRRQFDTAEIDVG